MPGAPPPEPTSTSVPVVARDELGGRERVVQEHAPRFGGLAKGGQSGRSDDCGEPGVSSVSGGTTMTQRFGSVPSLAVVDPRLLQPLVHDLPLDRRHRLERDSLAVAQRRSALRTAIASRVAAPASR